MRRQDKQHLELYATIIQVRGLSIYKTRFDSAFSTYEMPAPGQDYDSSYPFNVLELLILPFDYELSVMIRFGIFVILLFIVKYISRECQC